MTSGYCKFVYFIYVIRGNEPFWKKLKCHNYKINYTNNVKLYPIFSYV